MSPRSGPHRPCGTEEARARLHDADAFFEVAETATDPDVIATNAIHAAIAAADAICCMALRKRSGGPDHATAPSLLAQVDPKFGAP